MFTEGQSFNQIGSEKWEVSMNRVVRLPLIVVSGVTIGVGTILLMGGIGLMLWRTAKKKKIVKIEAPIG
jgi:maltodextrin utilization protein YvdJ